MKKYIKPAINRQPMSVEPILAASADTLNNSYSGSNQLSKYKNGTVWDDDFDEEDDEAY